MKHLEKTYNLIIPGQVNEIHIAHLFRVGEKVNVGDNVRIDWITHCYVRESVGHRRLAIDVSDLL